MTKTALITGISGQDGSYLAEHLVSLGYEVHGIVRRNSVPEHQSSRIQHLVDSGEVSLYYGDVTEIADLHRVMQEVEPDEVYNLAAQSHVGISFRNPWLTVQTNAVGAMNVLESCRRLEPMPRYYQASSSEMFGTARDEDGHQRETTPMHPTSPYGCAKLFAYAMTRHYRRAYGMFAANGILFNHESSRRGSNFVTSKIVKTAILIKQGKAKKLHLGNIGSFRDWGFAGDYVRAMRLILQHSEPDDFVIATGETRSVRDLCELVFSRLGLGCRDHVVENDPRYVRGEELPYLCGDSSKARQVLGWKPEVSFEEMIDGVIEHWLGVLGA